MFQVSCAFLLHFLVKSHLSQEDKARKHLPNPTVLPLLIGGIIFFHSFLSEQHVFVGNESFHHKSLVSNVIERRHGVQLGGPHQCRAEDDAQVLAGHEVLLLVLGHSGCGEDRNRARSGASLS